jgi:hypothetical protein
LVLVKNKKSYDAVVIVIVLVIRFIKKVWMIRQDKSRLASMRYPITNQSMNRRRNETNRSINSKIDALPIEEAQHSS